MQKDFSLTEDAEFGWVAVVLRNVDHLSDG